LDKPIKLTLTRAEIVIEDVGYAGFVSPGVAYVSLNGFIDKAYSEVRRAIGQLREKGKIEKFILDLRGNPGGLLDAAVDIVNIFVPAGEKVVYTKGYREGEIVFKTRKQPILVDVPLAILVDEGSARATEIVAGDVQDMDRAVIAGKETFGKGLVQKVFNIDNASDAKVKITTAKYYIPSGRSIQKKDYGVGNEVIVDKKLNDEALARYFTKNKREVFDHGGVHPDISIDGDSLGYVLFELIRKNHFFNFAVKYYQENQVWNDTIFENGKLFKGFKSYLKENNFEFETEGNTEIQKLRQIAKNRSSSKELMDLIVKLEQKLESEKENYLDDESDQIIRYLKLELAEKYHGRKGRYKYSIENDLQVRGAISVLANQPRYNKILAVK